ELKPVVKNVIRDTKYILSNDSGGYRFIDNKIWGYFYVDNNANLNWMGEAWRFYSKVDRFFNDSLDWSFLGGGRNTKDITV
ncbi:hypothetical protein, partial [Salmonella enterica]|uniref:hypothetical protein n=1 Tax=Salmonella enterica TaxID=28901 RepID=UPI0032B31F6E